MIIASHIFYNLVTHFCLLIYKGWTPGHCTSILCVFLYGCFQTVVTFKISILFKNSAYKNERNNNFLQLLLYSFFFRTNQQKHRYDVFCVFQPIQSQLLVLNSNPKKLNKNSTFVISLHFAAHSFNLLNRESLPQHTSWYETLIKHIT